MDKQKQIEEMAKEINRILFEDCLLNQGGHCEDCECIREETKYYDCQSYLCAKQLLEKYQPKIPENAVIVSKQIWEEHIENWDKTTKVVEERVRKETAEKFAEMAKELLDKQEKGWSANMIWIITAKNCIDEICKEITEGKNEQSNE